MYAIRLNPGTYPPPLTAGMYVAQSAIASEIRFTPNVQTARTWGRYEEAYRYLDENLYGTADVVTVVSTNSLLANIKKIGQKVPTNRVARLAVNKQNKKPALTVNKKPALTESTTSKSDNTFSPEPEEDGKLYLYRLYRKSEFPFEGEFLAEEWATEAEVAEVNKEALPHGLVWVKAEDKSTGSEGVAQTAVRN